MLKFPGFVIFVTVQNSCAWTFKQYTLKGFKFSSKMELLVTGPITYGKDTVSPAEKTQWTGSSHVQLSLPSLRSTVTMTAKEEPDVEGHCPQGTWPWGLRSPLAASVM